MQNNFFLSLRVFFFLLEEQGSHIYAIFKHFNELEMAKLQQNLRF